jgi:hypothetical protein
MPAIYFFQSPVGGEAGQRLAQELMLQGNRDTLLRILRARPALDVAVPQLGLA